MKQSEKKDPVNKEEFTKLPLISKNPLFTSNNLNNAIKNLSKPNFLGSIHLKQEPNVNLYSVENLIESELKLKMTKSLKNTLLNPLTKTLIILAILFNLFWLLFIYIL
ncbi:MAG: hypothetical protein ACFE9I_17615 [Candidatus Hermodarchaeota archaeon]